MHTQLYDLADLVNPSDYSTHVNQLILAKQLIEHGANANANANANAVSSQGERPS
jgi:hypothetical protein